VTTFAVYSALGTVLFVVVLRLQISLGYSALEAGASLFPSIGLTFVLSPFAGWLGQRIGVRAPMTIGPMIIAIAMLLFGRIGANSTYIADVLPAGLVFGCGMALTSAPLTAAVFGGVSDSSFAIASSFNNAVARVGGLFAVAVIPAIADLSGGESMAGGLDRGYQEVMNIAAAVCVLGAVAAFVFIRTTARTVPIPSPGSFAACQHASVAIAPDGRSRCGSG
jgi:MFS family permease